MQVRHAIRAMMFGLLSVLWITSDLSLANEAPLAKPESIPVPAQIPAPPKPHVAESEPNDTANQANVYTMGDTITATIPLTTDVDYYTYSANAGDT